MTGSTVPGPSKRYPPGSGATGMNNSTAAMITSRIIGSSPLVARSARVHVDEQFDRHPEQAPDKAAGDGQDCYPHHETDCAITHGSLPCLRWLAGRTVAVRARLGRGRPRPLRQAPQGFAEPVERDVVLHEGGVQIRLGRLSGFRG